MTACAALEHDAELMLRVRAGDSQSFALLLEKHRQPLVNFLYRIVQNQAIAEELAQEVFLRVYRSRDSYEPTAKFRTWLLRIASHLALNAIRDSRHERRHQRLDEQPEDGGRRDFADHSMSVEQRMVREAKLEQVRRAIGVLPEKQRLAVIMHKYEELDYAQIASVLGVTEPAVKSLLFRAYESLRARLAEMA